MVGTWHSPLSECRLYGRNTSCDHQAADTNQTPLAPPDHEGRKVKHAPLTRKTLKEISLLNQAHEAKTLKMEVATQDLCYFSLPYGPWRDKAP